MCGARRETSATIAGASATRPIVIATTVEEGGFGKGAAPVLDPARSLASNPVYSKGNTVVTVKLKGWKWSNGETITGRQRLEVLARHWAEGGKGAMAAIIGRLVCVSAEQGRDLGLDGLRQ